MHPVIKRGLALLLFPLAMAWGGATGEVGDAGPVTGPGPGGAITTGLGWLFEGFQRLDVDGEALLGSDITVLRTSGSYEQERGDFTVGATLAYTDLDIDYSASGTFDNDRSEFNREGSVSLGWKARDDLEVTLTGGASSGYPDYQSVWIAEYYRQLFGLGFFPAYRAPDPNGWSLGAAVVWDAVRGATRLTATLRYGKDEIVEGWSFGAAGLESGRNHLETATGALGWEQALTGWLKAQHSARISEVTDREPRLQLQSAWALALGPDWTVRLDAGATRERPAFEAYYAGASVHYEFLPGWHVSLSARYYEDTGEIESSGFSTAAPGLQTYELGASLLYDRGDFAIRVSGGYLDSRYEPLEVGNEFFGNLYGDREWWLTRIAVSYSF